LQPFLSSAVGVEKGFPLLYRESVRRPARSGFRFIYTGQRSKIWRGPGRKGLRTNDLRRIDPVKNRSKMAFVAQNRHVKVCPECRQCPTQWQISYRGSVGFGWPRFGRAGLGGDRKTEDADFHFTPRTQRTRRRNHRDTEARRRAFKL
jgi:hypothetical protein